ncbi:ScbR family autoregulator-binding transcription factor [Streptomyces sp. NPDC059900]|uniref:ScbR family autoregulator-binding transcription factor n=1 Tax=Streptomyces sp. NPDC059900 TaxID=3155816 RepID=UPI003421D0B3
MAQREVKQERAVRTRAALVTAAAEVFGELGFAGTTVAKITERAGVTLGALYFHFKNKEEVAREIVRNQPRLVVPPRDSQGLQHAIDVTMTWARMLLDDPILLAGARLVMDQEHFISKEENSHGQWTQLLAEDFRTAQRKRELRAKTDVDALARLVVNACTGAQMHAHLESGRRDLPDRVEEMWQCLLPAIAPPGAIARMRFDATSGDATSGDATLVGFTPGGAK